MDSLLVLLIYRHRVDIEHMISSIKSVINLDPMRVWGEKATRGKIVLALITQFIVAVAMNDMEPIFETKHIDGIPVTAGRRCSAKTFAQELNAYLGILMREDWGGFRTYDLKDTHTAERIIPIIERYESEAPIVILPDMEWMPILPAQWSDGEKNFQDLAMSIEQAFSKIIFSDLMVSRRRCSKAFEEAKQWEREHK